MQTSKSLLLLSLFAFQIFGCATFTRGAREEVFFESNPPGALVTLRPDGETVTTPGSLSLLRKKEYQAVFELDGFDPIQVDLKRFDTGAALGNAVLGGFMGAAADAHSGGGLSFSPNPVGVTFRTIAAEKTSTEHSASALVTFLNTTSWRSYSEETGAVFIKVDDRFVTTLPIDETFEVALEPGAHTLHLKHIGLFSEDSRYPIELEPGETTIEVFCRPFSTEFLIVDPENGAFSTDRRITEP